MNDHLGIIGEIFNAFNRMTIFVRNNMNAPFLSKTCRLK